MATSSVGEPVSASDCSLVRALVVAFVLFTGVFAATARAQDPSPLMSVEALGLDREQVRRVTVYFSTADKEHALQFATLSEAAGAYFEREFGASFPLRLAVLSPEDWFDPYPGGDSLPYGMPWGWVDDLLMTAPASLDTGVLIFGPDRDANRQRVEFVLLHEFGHLASKQYLHPDGPRPYSSVKWFEEFLATYFAYAYVRTHDPEWAEASRKEWLEFVRGYSPAVISLDWSFMQELPPGEFARTYAWYQNLLNLRVVDVYDRHGLNFLRTIGEHLPWEKSGNWTNESVLRSLDEFAPGFEAWAGGLEIGDYLPAVSALDEER